MAALLAVAARGPNDGPADVFHVASGARNPLRYRQLVDLVRNWYLENPLADSNGQPIVVPEWSFPGRGRVQRQLQQATRAMSAAEKVLQALPVRGKQADLTTQLEERREEAERALGYVELYGAYTETEAVFGVDRLVELWDRARRRRPRRLLLRPRRHRLAGLRPRRPPALGGGPRPGPHLPRRAAVAARAGRRG